MDDIPLINALPEKLRGWAVLGAILFPYLTRAYYGLTRCGGLVGMWRAVLFGTNTPQDPAVIMPKTKTITLPLMLLAGALVLAAPSFTGCATSPDQLAAKSLVTTAQTVDTAMQTWAAWVVLGKATPQAESQVRQAYGRYQFAFALARNAYLQYDRENPATWSEAAAALRRSQADLLALVNEFTKEKPKP